ncbi:heme exporter protein CcmB [Haliangium ochraceum]|uniref:heme exporter protein CcmB n=1 Tax=Haliangium ochraceum TaxID=80816 RepID=UPI00019BAFB5|nr:heme exporter protein CcmB [Haliangium ochraceum]
MEFLRNVATLAWKDLRVEFRSREILYTMAFFGVMIILIFSFAFVRQDGTVGDVVPGMLWVAVAFAGTLGLSRAFERERESDTMRALLLAPASRTAIFLGKAVAIVVFMGVVELVVVPLIALLFGAELFAHPLLLVTVLLLATAGYAIVGCVFAAMLLRVRARDVLLPVVLYPVLVPMLIAGTKATAALLPVAGVSELETAYFWIRFLCVYDAIFAVVALWTFESLVIE